MKELEVAMVIGRDGSGKFLALRQNLDHNDDPRYRENPWETAGGKPDENEEFPEDIVATAKRELREETGFDGRYVGPESYPTDEHRIEHRQIKEEEGGEVEYRIYFYPVPLQIEEKEPEPALSREHDDYEWCQPEKFLEELPEHNAQGLRNVMRDFE